MGDDEVEKCLRLLLPRNETPRREGGEKALQPEGACAGAGLRAEERGRSGYRESWAGRAVAAVYSFTLPGGAAGPGLSKF
ncbi:hypothetical protein H8959_022442 [Pygathrix nigripes]